MMLKQFADNVWYTDINHPLLGVKLKTSMTVVRLPSGKLWIHSPVSLTPELIQEIDGLGEVAFVVAPNCKHYLYLEPFCRQYPDAKSYGAPKLSRKLAKLYPGFQLTEELTDLPPAEWEAQFQQRLLKGIPVFQEVVFLHQPSKTLIVTDMLYSLGSAANRLLAPAVNWLNLDSVIRDLYSDKFIPMPKDKTLLSESIQRILDWDFDRIIIGHGGNIEKNGKAVVTRVYQSYLTF